MKKILKHLLGKAGFTAVHQTDDVVLREMLEAYGELRLKPGAKEAWQHRLAAVAAFGHLRDLLGLHQIHTVIDVGANLGQFGLRLRKCGFQGTILSFEPMRQARTKLEQVAVQHPPWKVFPIALGSRAEEKKLQIFKDDTFSSLHAVNQAGKKIFGSYVQADAEEVVKVETLDRLIEQGLGKEVHGPVLLKTDTQGHDLEALRGGVQLLRQVNVVLTEAAVEVIYEGAPDFIEILVFLRQQGFEASGFYPFSHRPETLAMVEFDAFFVRKK